MNRHEVHKDALALVRAGLHDREGLAMALDIMPEIDKRVMLESLVGLNVALLCSVAKMTDRTADEMLESLFEIVKYLEQP